MNDGPMSDGHEADITTPDTPETPETPQAADADAGGQTPDDAAPSGPDFASLGLGTEIVDVLVTQTKGPARQLAASAGYGTGEGIKLTGSWTHRNMFPPEGALTVEAVAGTLQQSLGTTFRRSNAGQRDRVFALGASVARQDFDAYNAQTLTLSGSLSRQSTPIFQKRWTWSVGGELIATRETPFEAATLDRDRNTYFIAAIPLQIGYDRSNSQLDPTKGFRLSARVSPEAQKRSGGGFDVYELRDGARILASVAVSEAVALLS